MNESQNGTQSESTKIEGVQVPILQETPEQKYEGTWEPGINHPVLEASPDGPYAGIPIYLPIPERQIER